jgi:hypothetical protein
VYLKAEGTVAYYGLTHLTLVCEPVRCVRPKSVINYRVICSIHSFRTFYHFALYPLFNWERSILTSVHRTRKVVRSDESTPVCQRLKNVLMDCAAFIIHCAFLPMHSSPGQMAITLTITCNFSTFARPEETLPTQPEGEAHGHSLP